MKKKLIYSWLGFIFTALSLFFIIQESATGFLLFSVALSYMFLKLELFEETKKDIKVKKQQFDQILTNLKEASK